MVKTQVAKTNECCMLGTVVEGRENFVLVAEKIIYLVFLVLTYMFLSILLKH